MGQKVKVCKSIRRTTAQSKYSNEWHQRMFRPTRDQYSDSEKHTGKRRKIAVQILRQTVVRSIPNIKHKSDDSLISNWFESFLKQYTLISPARPPPSAHKNKKKKTIRNKTITASSKMNDHIIPLSVDNLLHAINITISISFHQAYTLKMDEDNR